MSTSGSESRSGVVLELAEEFIERYRAGERPSLKEYIDRHPSLAGEIREVFPAMAMMEKIAFVDESGEDPSMSVGRTIDKPTVPIRIAPLEKLGDYRIIREVGRGGMGVVYEAEQVSLGRHVALKVLPAHALANDKQKRRFEREARAAARLHHTNIVPVFGVGEHEGVSYYVMQFIQGMGLDSVVDELKRLRKGGEARIAASAGEIKVSRRDETPVETVAGVDRNVLSDSSRLDRRRDVTAADLARSLVTGRFHGMETEDINIDRESAVEATVAFESSDLDASSNEQRDAEPGEAKSIAASSTYVSKISDSFILSASAHSSASGGRGIEPKRSRDKRKAKSYWESVASIGVQIASALEYAHNQGVQHRDVKPSNLLLDTRGTVWITDFGLAKDDDQRNITQTGDILGTLRYMPPEAFEGKVDTRGDIFALGITLYEMLVLRPAFDERERGKLVKRVTTEDAPRLGKIDPTVPADLETIVHKAIDRDPNHRYQTAGELAADLERFIADEPIAARRLSPIERANRWRRRNPVVAGLAAALFMLMTTVTIGSLIIMARMADLADRRANLALKERRSRLTAKQSRVAADANRIETENRRTMVEAQRKRAQASTIEADAQRKRAEVGYAKARGIVDDYVTNVGATESLRTPAFQPLRRELLTSAVTFYQNFLTERSDDSKMRAATAAAYLLLGKTQRDLGDPQASTTFEQAFARYAKLVEENPADLELAHGLAQCQVELNRYDEAIAIWTKIVKPDDPRFRRDLADALERSADRELKAGRFDRAWDAARSGAELREGLVGSNASDVASRLDLAKALRILARATARKTGLADGLPIYLRAYEEAGASRDRAPDDIRAGRVFAEIARELGKTYWNLNQKDKAIASLREANDVWARLAEDNPVDASIKSELYVDSMRLSSRYQEAGRAAESKRAFGRARSAIEARPDPTSEDLFNLACVWSGVAARLDDGTAELATAEKEEQKRFADGSIDWLEKAVAAGFKDPERLRTTAELASVRSRADFQDLAARLDARAIADAIAKKRNAEIEKLKATEEALAVRKSPAKADPTNQRLHADAAASRSAVARIQISLGKTDAAIESMNEAIVAAENNLKRDPKNVDLRSNLAENKLAMGETLWQAGKLAEAERLSGEGLESLRGLAGDHPGDATLTRKRIAALDTIYERYARERMWREASRYRAESVALDPTDNRKTYRLAPLMLYAGDIEGYQRLRADFLARFADTNDPGEAERTAKACLLLPIDGPELERIERLADKAIGDRNHDQYPNGLLAKGMAEYRKGRFQDAEGYIEKSLDLNPHWSLQAPAKYILAMTRYRQGQVDRARKTLFDNDNYINTIHNNRSGLPEPFKEMDLKDWLIGLILQREAHELIEGRPFPEFPVDVLHRSEIHYKLGKHDVAEAEFEASVASRPDDAAIRLERGRFFDRIGRHDRAVADFTKAIELEPDDHQGLRERGRILTEMGKTDLAVADFNKAIELKPDDPQSLRERGRIFAELGKTDLAVADFTKALDLARDEPAREEIFDESAVNPEVFARVFENRKPTLAWCNERRYRFGSQGLWKQTAVVAARLTEHEPDSDWNLMQDASLRLFIDDVAGYRRICRGMLARFGGTGDPLIAYRTALTCTLAPDAVDNFNLVQALTDRSIQGNDKHEFFRRFLLVGAMADYRSGRFKSALARIKRTAPSKDGDEVDAHAFALLAATFHHMARIDEARAAFVKARIILDRRMKMFAALPTVSSAWNDWNLTHSIHPSAWSNWLRAEIVYREAEGLILDADFPTDPFHHRE